MDEESTYSTQTRLKLHITVANLLWTVAYVGGICALWRLRPSNPNGGFEQGFRNAPVEGLLIGLALFASALLIGALVRRIRPALKVGMIAGGLAGLFWVFIRFIHFANVINSMT